MRKSNEIALEMNAILSCPAGQRSRSIIDSPYCDEILQLIPVQDAFLIVKESFGGDNQFLLPSLPPERIVSFIDIDCWNGDIPNIENVFEWLKELQFASDDTLLEAINTLDPELIILLYHPVLKIIVTSPTDDNIPDILEAGYETFDNNYFFSFTVDNEETRLLKFILERSFAYNQDMYFRILEGVRWELAANMEENAYQQRSFRLTELGFPPPDEAASIYSRIRLYNLVGSRLRTDQVPLIDEPGKFFLPTLYKEPLKASRLLMEAMSEAGTETVEKFAFEMMYLANKILMADFKPINEKDSIINAVEKAAAIVSIGLADAAKMKGIKASEVLENMTAQTLFSVGYNILLDLRDRVIKCRKSAGKIAAPASVREYLEALIHKHPVTISGRYVSNDDISCIIEAVEYIESLKVLLSKTDNLKAEYDATNCGTEGIDMENVILTVLAVNTITGKSSFRPLEISEFKQFLDKATMLQKNRRMLKPAFRKDMNALIEALMPEDKERVIKGLVDRLCFRLEAEIEGLAHTQIDPRFVTCLIVKI